MTQAELAEEAGLAQSTAAQIESGVRSEPHPRTLKKLARVARALGVTPRDLLDDIADTSPPSRLI